MSLAKLVARKLTVDEIQELHTNVVADLSGIQGLVGIIAFGSAVYGTMSEASDIDVALIFDTSENSNRARKVAHSLRKRSKWPMDLLCVDVATFRRKNKVGGIYFVVRKEGRVIFGKMP